VSEVGLKKTELDTPVLWVDLDQLERNITYLAGYFKAAGVGWRPHTKGVKVPAIAHQAMVAGALGVTCAKLGEAEVMAAAGIRDILIANQIVGPHKAARLAHLQRHADVKVAVDNVANVTELGAAAKAVGVEIGVVVEVDTGMQRAGVAPGQPTAELSCLVHQTPGLRYVGLMTWEGHTRSIADLDERRGAIERSMRQLTESVDLCRQAGLPVHIVSCGGSGTYYVSAFHAGVTEIQAGGAIFGDVTYQGWGVETTPCLFVRAMVTSHPAPDRVIVDAGFKTLPQWAGQPRAVGLRGVKSMYMAAEHGILTLEAPDSTLEVGDALDFILGYGDATLFLHDQLYGIRNGRVEVVWAIQGRGKLR
jgi:D-serine deaminase-like pyridoxal phosphate-dependent protein